MSFVAVAGLAITAGAAAYSGYNASQGPDDPSAVFGKRPRVAPFVPIDLATEQGRSTQSNISNIDTIMAMLDRSQPGFSSTLKAGMENAGKLVNGEIPQDVMDQIMGHDAFQSMIGGYSGTGMSRNLTTRDLGRTSLDLMTTGQNSMQLWSKLASDTYKPYLITTEDQVAATAANNVGQQETLQRQYNVAAAADPAAVGAYQLELAQNQALMQSIGQIGSSLGTLSRSGLGGSLSSSYTNFSGGAPYATNAGSFGVPRASLVEGPSPAFFYNPSTGRYESTGGGG